MSGRPSYRQAPLVLYRGRQPRFRESVKSRGREGNDEVPGDLSMSFSHVVLCIAFSGCGAFHDNAVRPHILIGSSS